MINGSIYSCLIQLFNLFVGCYSTSSEQQFFQNFFIFYQKFYQNKNMSKNFFSVTFFLIIYSKQEQYLFSVQIFFILQIYSKQEQEQYFFQLYFLFYIQNNNKFKINTKCKSSRQKNEHFGFRLPVVKKRGYMVRKKLPGNSWS